jgi:hypothetical protein
MGQNHSKTPILDLKNYLIIYFIKNAFITLGVFYNYKLIAISWKNYSAERFMRAPILHLLSRLIEKGNEIFIYGVYQFINL